jgi:ribosomal protein S18 acetylase RimI-like enzyme
VSLASTAPRVGFRRPTEADHAAVVAVADEWWAGRRVRRLLPRLWFRHFASTSWIAQTDDGRLAGFLVGFVSPDRPDEACVHMAATNPNLRRRGIGRALFARFADDVTARGVVRVSAVIRPEDRPAVEFLRAIGFDAFAGPGTERIHGVPALADYDGEGEDRAVFVMELGVPG